MILYIIIGMAIVTAVPRFIPAILVDRFVFRDWMNRWLQAIPYAALGALIFPGILSVKEDAPHIGIIGGIVATLLAYIGLNIIFVVIGAIMTVYILMMF
ncbi:MAG TPA: AzlD domain-containing protein [Pseudogracilibacillus sp.]|nr:AzlD domain-containing protein [Pseudogracilibacillus sp.]